LLSHLFPEVHFYKDPVFLSNFMGCYDNGLLRFISIRSQLIYPSAKIRKQLGSAPIQVGQGQGILVGDITGGKEPSGYIVFVMISARGNIDVVGGLTARLKWKN